MSLDVSPPVEVVEALCTGALGHRSTGAQEHRSRLRGAGDEERAAGEGDYGSERSGQWNVVTKKREELPCVASSPRGRGGGSRRRSGNALVPQRRGTTQPRPLPMN
ncbi:hypothetical protein JHW43_006617 [Diplocarpon mali]|nr:hypothetical protein JHW43_006617 [Diplocarpon mali]